MKHTRIVAYNCGVSSLPLISPLDLPLTDGQLKQEDLNYIPAVKRYMKKMFKKTKGETIDPEQVSEILSYPLPLTISLMDRVCREDPTIKKRKGPKYVQILSPRHLEETANGFAAKTASVDKSSINEFAREMYRSSH